MCVIMRSFLCSDCSRCSTSKTQVDLRAVLVKLSHVAVAIDNFVIVICTHNTFLNLSPLTYYLFMGTITVWYQTFIIFTSSAKLIVVV